MEMQRPGLDREPSDEWNPGERPLRPPFDPWELPRRIAAAGRGVAPPAPLALNAQTIRDLRAWDAAASRPGRGLAGEDLRVRLAADLAYLFGFGRAPAVRLADAPEAGDPNPGVVRVGDVAEVEAALDHDRVGCWAVRRIRRTAGGDPDADRGGFDAEGRPWSESVSGPFLRHYWPALVAEVAGCVVHDLLARRAEAAEDEEDRP